MDGWNASSAPSHIYYFDIGNGQWAGEFRFRVVDWRALRREHSGLKNVGLSVAMHFTQRLTGPARLSSIVTAAPNEGAFGVADNLVTLSKWGLTLYWLKERYVLDADGTSVAVHAHERFGPLRGVFERRFDYPAEIHAGGMSSTYHMPLLGSAWKASYQVAPDLAHLSGTLVCTWALANEQAQRRASGTLLRDISEGGDT
ncbi:MAG: hypothetical protein ACJ71T_01280 [Actinomycetales bacterium]